MPKLDIPLQLAPVFKPKIWGRQDLGPLFSHPQRPAGEAHDRGGGGDSGAESRVHAEPWDRQAEPDPIGEVWLTDDSAQFVNGPVAGLTLDEVSRQYGFDLHGSDWKHPRFPILAKYIYTSDWLSVQIHPDDDYARAHESASLGKTEAWYIVDAGRNAEFLLGLKPGTTKDTLRAACEQGASRNLLVAFNPEPGEAMFVPAGTVHALGPGLVLMEVEQNSDITYRLDDFGRLGLDGKPRPVHLDKGLAATRVELPAHRNLPRLEFPEVYGSRRYVVACRFFALEEWVLRKRSSFHGNPQRVEVLAIVSGGGRLETTAGWLAYRTGEVWLIPPGLEDYRVVPEQRSRLLKFYVPDLDRDFRQPLAQRGVPADEIGKIVFE